MHTMHDRIMEAMAAHIADRQMILVQFGEYVVYRYKLRQAQMVLAQAKREIANGDVDSWYYAGCPIGNGYAAWRKRMLSAH
jgi:hypothetical protein